MTMLCDIHDTPLLSKITFACDYVNEFPPLSGPAPPVRTKGSLHRLRVGTALVPLVLL